MKLLLISDKIIVLWKVPELSVVFSVWLIMLCQLGSLEFSHSVMSNSLRPHDLQHTRPPCPSTTPGVHPNPCPLSRWCHPAISSSIVPFSYCPQSFPASGSFQMSQLFALGGQSIGVSASTSVLPVNTQDIIYIYTLKIITDYWMSDPNPWINLVIKILNLAYDLWVLKHIDMKHIEAYGYLAYWSMGDTGFSGLFIVTTSSFIMVLWVTIHYEIL